MNVLVIGGAGFIGSHACKVLSQRGFQPVVYDNLLNGHSDAVRWGPLEIGSVSDPLRLREIFEKYRPAALMHFAALTSVSDSVSDPTSYYVNNVANSALLLKAIIDTGPIPIVFSSTAAVYGSPTTIPIPEDHPLKPINPYGASKMFVEQMLAHAGVGHKLPWMALRYFNAAGSDPDGEIGERHEPETHLIPLTIKAALAEKAIQVYGTNYDTPDGSCVRDYVHVMDIADAHVRALDYLLDGGKSMALNLANSRGYSVKEVISTVEQVCGRKIVSQCMPRRDGDPPILIGASDTARKVLGWKPQHSELRHQISDAWKWFSKTRNSGTATGPQYRQRARVGLDWASSTGTG